MNSIAIRCSWEQWLLWWWTSVTIPRLVDDNRIAHAARASVVATILHLHDNTARYCAAYSWPSGPCWICVRLALCALRKAGHREVPQSWLSLLDARPCGREMALLTFGKVLSPRNTSTDSSNTREHTPPIDYYRTSPYGRFLSRRVAGEKLSREARAVAFVDHVDVDAPCCHPRLLVLTLHAHGLWDQDRSP